MMKPYYAHAGIEIYCADCREILPSLRFDVLVTDPPYGVAFEGKNTKHTTRRDDGYTVADSDIGISVVTSVIIDLTRP